MKYLIMTKSILYSVYQFTLLQIFNIKPFYLLLQANKLYKSLNKLCFLFVDAKMFIIVKNRSSYEAIPENWAILDESDNEIVYWPKQSLKTLQKDPKTFPDIKSGTWFAGKDVVIKRYFDSWTEANIEVERLLSLSESESEQDQNERNLRSFMPCFDVSLQKLLTKPPQKQIQKPTGITNNIPPIRIQSTAHNSLEQQSAANILNRANESNADEVFIKTIVDDDDTLHDEFLPNDNEQFNDNSRGAIYCHSNTTNVPANIIDSLGNQTVANTQKKHTLHQQSIDDKDQIDEVCFKATLNKLKKMSDRILSLETDMKLLLENRDKDNTSGDGNKCEHCMHCYPSLLKQVVLLPPIEKIKTREELESLEKNLAENDEFKKKFINYCNSIIGIDRTPEDFGVCCLELSRAIFDKSFWGLTTWHGTSNTGRNKFAFSAFVVFLGVFRYVICRTTKTIPSQYSIAKFFQDRAKNCAQQLKVQEHRRLRGPRKRGPKGKRDRAAKRARNYDETLHISDCTQLQHGNIISDDSNSEDVDWQH